MTVVGSHIGWWPLLLITLVNTTWIGVIILAAAFATRKYRRRQVDRFAWSLQERVRETLLDISEQLEQANAQEASRVIEKLLPLLAQRTAEMNGQEEES